MMDEMTRIALEQAKKSCNPPILVDEQGNFIRILDDIIRDEKYWASRRAEEEMDDTGYEDYRAG